MKLKVVADYIDQPLLINKIERKTPHILGAATLGLLINTSGEKQERKKKFLSDIFVLGGVFLASLVGIYGIRKKGVYILNPLMDIKKKQDVLKEQANSVEDFLKQNPQKDISLVNILNKSKEKVLSIKEIEYLKNNIKDYKKYFNPIKDINSKEIFSEISRLSALGALPVIGGMAGGFIGDRILGHKNREKDANRIKEGFYQYFANIFLCNVGAGAALYSLEKLHKSKPPSRALKLGAIVGGIVSVGIIGGSAIANRLGEKIIDPMLCKDRKHHPRKPEALDVFLHSDDIATAGVLSGLKWIEPMLPAMYMLSGYRAGIGYRNGKEKHHTEVIIHDDVVIKSKKHT